MKSPGRSLRSRLLISASVVLLLFLVLAILVLDGANRRGARAAIEEHLTAHLYALLTVAEIRDGSLYIPGAPGDPRFAVPESGLYGFVFDGEGNLAWQSDSATGLEPPPIRSIDTGVFEHSRSVIGDVGAHFVLQFDVVWEIGPEQAFRYSFHVIESADRYRAGVDRFRESLFIWGGLSTLLLLSMQLLTIYWALNPLQRVSDELEQIESGGLKRLSDDYPDEIAQLTGNINHLIDNSRRALERYRNALGDLAHSLKTPLAVIRGAADQNAEEGASVVAEQGQRMNEIIEYQLKRAASAASSAGLEAIEIKAPVEQLVQTLKKVFADKSIEYVLEIPDAARIKMDQGDLMEVVGNVLENACKWCAGRIEISCQVAADVVQLIVDDDGPGIDDEMIDSVFNRGVRAEQQIPGQGIGLAVVRDILESYKGRVTVSRSGLGGARLILHLPC